MQVDGNWTDAIAAMAQGATLVTANARLARRAQSDQAATHRASGDTIWRRGDSLPWHAWLTWLHEDALVTTRSSHQPATLLTSAQTTALWQEIVEADDAAATLLRPRAAALDAADARNLSLAWRLPPDAITAHAHHEDVRAFLRWHQVYNQQLKNRNWVDAAMLPDRVAEWLEADEALRPDRLWLAGFAEFTPQQRDFLDRLIQCGVTVQIAGPPPEHQAAVVRTGCADAEDEIRRAASWARQQLTDNPAAQIAIIVRDLEQRRSDLTRHLDAVLVPAFQRKAGRHARRPWNLSLGHSLADEPAIHDALIMLRAAAGPLRFTEASRLLRSPFLGGAETERGARLRLERQLREARETRIRTRWLARLADTAEAPELAERLRNLINAAADVTGKQTILSWVEHFSRLLSLLGWPGERSLDSHEFQAVGAWQETLATGTSLSAVLEPIHQGAALAQLSALTAETTFQPRSDPAPVQVIGMLEALGQSFDAAWVMGLDDENWPQRPRPNPFLPMALQRTHALPRATAERELEFADEVTRQLLSCAPHVTASWPRRVDDRPLQPSPLIADLPESTDTPTMLPDAGAAILAGARLESWDDPAGPPVADPSQVRGGTQVLTDQSACPFRAFARHRLQAGPLETPQSGLDPRERGAMVHQILAALWHDLEDQDALAALAPDARADLVTTHVTTTIGIQQRRQPTRFSETTVALETRRLEQLIHQWIACELERPPFRVIAREQPVEITIDALTLRGKIDRIDELPNGQRILVDYKTGEVEPAKWLGDRPTDPQLPLYSLTFDDRLGGLLFGQVRTHDCHWAGIVEAEMPLRKVKLAEEMKAADGASWSTLRSGWQAAAEQLATEYLAGYAVVRPQHNACQYCHLGILCRVEESA